MTDESLRLEREKADHALADELSSIEQTADAVIIRARERADRVLATARGKTDRELASSASSSANPITVARERREEDRALRHERAAADETLRDERAEFTALLSRERRETDKDLSRERASSDDAVAMRDEFLGIVSHDLKSMLNAMLGSAALIGSDVTGENPVAAVRRHAERIQRSAARMNRLIGDLVDVASIEAGVLAVNREVADPGAVVTEALDTFQAHAEKSGVSLVAQLAAPFPEVAFDPARILQVLINLLSNAIKFTPPPGRVEVRVERGENEVRFAVSDSGIGIPADQLESVFARFRQLRSNDRRGVGLGLYISKAIVKGHGGRIWAESTPGHGSTVSFALPTRSPAGA